MFEWKNSLFHELVVEMPKQLVAVSLVGRCFLDVLLSSVSHSGYPY